MTPTAIPMEIPGHNSVGSRSDDRMLIIMAKAPKPGMVKTRLARCLPPPAVTALYCCLLEDTLALARSLPGVEIAVMCPAADVPELASYASDGIEIVGQNGEGLAAALTSVFRQFTRMGRRVVAFNSDSPHLPASVLHRAFDALTAHDLVVGPTQDGGYYLVGAKAEHWTLFDGDGLGTKTALDGLLARARGLQLSVSSTEPFYDIDVEDDLFRLAEELRLSPARAPRTAVWLKEWEQAVPRLRTSAQAR
jgi:rSAM/selenodomain-associated transferase 1